MNNMNQELTDFEFMNKIADIVVDQMIFETISTDRIEEVYDSITSDAEKLGIEMRKLEIDHPGKPTSIMHGRHFIFHLFDDGSVDIKNNFFAKG